MCGDIETEREDISGWSSSPAEEDKKMSVACVHRELLQLAQRNFWKLEREASMHGVEERAGEETSRDREFRPLRRRERIQLCRLD